ncbi:MAG: hypothetical protein A4S09_08100 [Proteobacteria bacterium SG_bin7]|nr:MAG: hypothetical protein A4S09_08100 [Proteobacteria bacterium SG_bin7]
MVRLFFALTSTLWFSVGANAVDSAALAQEVSARIPRVEIFRVLREMGDQKKVKIYLFGGTASAYAHYVKWDMQREAGDSRFQKDRFDYDYSSIYRSTQDLDIVVDGELRDVAEVRASLQEKFSYVQGSKGSQWEVRSLRYALGEPGQVGYKEALLNDFGFLNQHSDSNSTGLIEITTPEVGDHIVRDLKDWDNKKSVFLIDSTEGTIKYYFSTRHEETPRAKAGINPPIFSVIRYLTKAFQYELKMHREDLEIIRKIVADFNPDRDLKNAMARAWIVKNGKKLIQHAVNIEYAINTLEELGLRQKLMQIDKIGEDSLSMWIAREPLRTMPLGTGNGKTAKELGIEIVAHETKNFLAYESITRAHTGDPNVLISRTGGFNEGALYGDGFYTRQGKLGAVGSGLTIRFNLHPMAREGVDFKRVADDYILILNKAAIRVIPESLNMSPIEYFQYLAQGKLFFEGDEGVRQKVRRRVLIRMSSLTENEEETIVKLVDKTLGPESHVGVGLRNLLANDFLLFADPKKHSDQIKLALANSVGNVVLSNWNRLRNYSFAQWELLSVLRYVTYGSENIEAFKELLVRAFGGAKTAKEFVEITNWAICFRERMYGLQSQRTVYHELNLSILDIVIRNLDRLVELNPSWKQDEMNLFFDSAKSLTEYSRSKLNEEVVKAFLRNTDKLTIESLRSFNKYYVESLKLDPGLTVMVGGLVQRSRPQQLFSGYEIQGELLAKVSDLGLFAETVELIFAYKNEVVSNDKFEQTYREPIIGMLVSALQKNWNLRNKYKPIDIAERLSKIDFLRRERSKIFEILGLPKPGILGVFEKMNSYFFGSKVKYCSELF